MVIVDLTDLTDGSRVDVTDLTGGNKVDSNRLDGNQLNANRVK